MFVVGCRTTSVVRLFDRPGPNCRSPQIATNTRTVACRPILYNYWRFRPIVFHVSKIHVLMRDFSSQFISFRECLRRRHPQPADGILICFVEAQQAAIQFCDRTRIDNVLHGLLLSAITERRCGKTPFMHVSTTWALACAETV